jgi:hypothetical protein
VSAARGERATFSAGHASMAYRSWDVPFAGGAER